MRQLVIILSLFVSVNVFGQEFKFNYHKDYERILALTNDTSSKPYYEKLLARFQNNDTTLTDYEVLALLIGFTEDEHYKPYSYLTIERKIYALNGNGEYQAAISKCDSFLLKIPLSQQALIEKSYSYYKLGQQDSADNYMWKFSKIMNAMGQSGDGLSPETAFFSLGPADGQNFIRKHLRGKIGTMGSGSDKHGNFVDILEMTWEDPKNGKNKKRDLYFQIQHASKTMFDDF